MNKNILSWKSLTLSSYAKLEKIDWNGKKDGYYSNSCPEFTELELEKIKGGRLYKKKVCGEETKVWIKPSIEIISLEEYGILWANKSITLN